MEIKAEYQKETDKRMGSKIRFLITCKPTEIAVTEIIKMLHDELGVWKIRNSIELFQTEIAGLKKQLKGTSK